MKRVSIGNLAFARKLTATSSALAIATSLALSPGAFAQEVETIGDDEDETFAQGEDTIVVTGSRIRTNEFTSPSPIQVIDPDLGVRQGRFDTGALVQGSTLAAGSSQLTSAISANSASPQGGQGVQTVSLRGLGANRTLVLINGRRGGPAGVRGQVAAFDLNVLPFSSLERVEILKDGASSIYGSDAVAGVVNLITRDDFDGLELDAFFSQPLEGAGEFLRTSAIFGKTFDRGHFQLTVDYQEQQRITKGDREFLDCPEDYIFDMAGNRADVVDPRGPGVHGFNYTGPDGYACTNGVTWGHIWLYDYSYYYSPNGSNNTSVNQRGEPDTDTQLLQYDYDGSLAALGIPQWPAPLDQFQIGLPSNVYPTGTNRQNYAIQQNYHVRERFDSFVPESTNFTIFVDGAYELTDGIELYADFLMSRRKTTLTDSTQYFNFGGTFDSPGIGAVFGFPPDPVVRPDITGDALISPTTYSEHDGQRTRVNYYRAISGLRGELSTNGWFDGWRWDLYAQHSRSRGEYRRDIISGPVVSGLGDSRSSLCAGTTIENFAGVITPCLDIDYNDPLILAGELTPGQRNLLYGIDIGRTKYDQTYVEAIFDGNLFTLPAGDVGVAIGATWRKDKINDTPGENARGGFIFLENPAGITEGSSRTVETFGEIKIPVLRDVPLFQSLDINGSLRWTDVNTVDQPDLTWKAGVDWQVFDWIKLRGTWGTSFRAPALFELFLNNESFIVRQSGVDPCISWGAALDDGGISQRIADNCAADGIPDDFSGGGVEPTVTLGGGLGQLAPETSTSKVAGVVLTPTFLVPEDASLSLAVDYYDIEVEGTVDTLTANQIVFGCYRSEVFPTDPLCDLFVRGQTGAPFNIDQITATFININSLRNTGIDITMQYTHDQLLAGWDLDVRSNWVHQLTDDQELFDGIVETVNGESGDPKWVGEVNLIASKGDWTAFWGMSVVGPTSDEQDFLDDNGDLCLTSATVGDYCVDLTAEAIVYHNVSLSKVHNNWNFTLGVSNLFDTNPPRVTTSGFNSAEISTIGQMPFASQYDVFGRRIFANITKTF